MMDSYLELETTLEVDLKVRATFVNENTLQPESLSSCISRQRKGRCSSCS